MKIKSETSLQKGNLPLENAIKALDDLIVIVEEQLENYNIKYSQPPYSYFKRDYIKSLLIYLKTYKDDIEVHNKYLKSGWLEALPEAVSTYQKSYFPHFFGDVFSQADFALQMKPSPYVGAKCLKVLPLLQNQNSTIIKCKSNFVQWNGKGGMSFDI